MSSTIASMIDDAFSHMRDALGQFQNGAQLPLPTNMPEAGQVETLETIPIPPEPIDPVEPVKAAGIMFIEPGGSVLMLKRGPGSDYPGMWCFPGGHTEDGETAEQTAEREAIEELGSLPKGKRIILARQIANGVDYTTFMQLVDKKFMPEINGEHTGFMWVDPKHILEI